MEIICAFFISYLSLSQPLYLNSNLISLLSCQKFLHIECIKMNLRRQQRSISQRSVDRKTAKDTCCQEWKLSCPQLRNFPNINFKPMGHACRVPTRADALIFHLRLNLSPNLVEREELFGSRVRSHKEFWRYKWMLEKLRSGWRFRGPERVINHLVIRTLQLRLGLSRSKSSSQHLCTLYNAIKKCKTGESAFAWEKLYLLSCLIHSWCHEEIWKIGCMTVQL